MHIEAIEESHIINHSPIKTNAHRQTTVKNYHTTIYHKYVITIRTLTRHAELISVSPYYENNWNSQTFIKRYTSSNDTLHQTHLLSTHNWLYKDKANTGELLGQRTTNIYNTNCSDCHVTSTYRNLNIWLTEQEKLQKKRLWKVGIQTNKKTYRHSTNDLFTQPRRTVVMYFIKILSGSLKHFRKIKHTIVHTNQYTIDTGRTPKHFLHT